MGELEISPIFNSIVDMVPLDRMQSIGFEFLYKKVGPSIKRYSTVNKKNFLNLLHQYKQNNMRVDSICVLIDRDIIFWIV